MEEFGEIIRLLHDSKFYYIITTNMQGKYHYVNQLYDDTFSHIHGSMKGQPYQITMHPDDMKVCEEVAQKCFQNPQGLYPATIRKHDGKGGYIITQWEYKAMFSKDGSPEGIFCLGYDITNHMQERFQLAASQKNLVEIQQELGEKEKVLKQIMFEQSHIIRRPVANILGLVHILEKMEVEQNLRNIIEMIFLSTTELDGVIKGIVDKAYQVRKGN